MDTITLLPFEAIRNDLYAKVQCTCPSKLFEGKPIAHLMKHWIKLVGYNDANFFDNVNREPRESACKCGRGYRYQWLRDGVSFAFLDAA